ncbi:MAG: hypothetical protein QM638_01155 [Nocardioides sp.]|uniref:hypothetical protein n=1 Tax=Nocardioides sp. TaxID=35761 RepID=UPI0039E47561
MSTFSARCVCGWSGTYDSEKKAKYALSRHSCEKQRREAERLAAAAAREAAREAAGYRTPKPCHHKRVTHVHGTRACYVLDRCRCKPCAKANAEATNWRERQKLYGRYDKYVDAEPVRAHVNALREYGIGAKRVAALAGIAHGAMSKLMYGVYEPTGRGGGRGSSGKLVRGPAKRVLRTTAEKILAVQAIPENRNPGQPDPDRTELARLKLRSLVALGWSMRRLAGLLDVNPANFGPLVHGSHVMERRTVDRIEALFDELGMTLPPETTQRGRISASRSRNYAKAHGWAPPLALPDLGAMPAERDRLRGRPLDAVAIERRMAGDRSVRLTPGEAAELVRRWLAVGRSLNELERRAGINPHRYRSTTATPPRTERTAG